MPSYLITGPDGKKYKVTGADAQGALNALKRQFGGGSADVGSAGMSPDIGASIPDVAVGNGAQRQFDNLPMWAKPIVAADDIASLALNGITSGFGDKALAGLDSLIGRGSYEDQLATRRKVTEDARTRAGVAGAVAEIGGAVLPAAKLAKMGVTATRLPGMYGRLGGMAADGAAFGALSAVGNDQDIGTGAAIGAGFGAGGQAVGNVVGTLAKPFMARINPRKATQETLLKAMDEAGQTPLTLQMNMRQAYSDGQRGTYAMMDALGVPGQRLASTVTRTPSAGRTPMVDFLEKRQAGQGRRVTGILEEGFDTATAKQKIKELSKARNDAGNVNYTAARNEAGFVDTTAVIKAIDDKLGVRPAPKFSNNPIAARVQARSFRASPVGDGVGQDSIGQSLISIRKMLAGKNGVQRMDFNKLLRVRTDLGDEASKAFRAGANAKYGAIKDVLNQLDAALADASGGYKKALQKYADDSRVLEAVDTGRAAARGGRIEDTIPAFSALTDEGQAAFRTGYVDPLIEKVQGQAAGVNKVREFTSDAYQAEFPQFAAQDQADLMMRRLGRENTMFATRAETLGSKTANNLADEADVSVLDPSIIGNVLSGNWSGAAKNALLQGISALKGQPPAVRKMLSDALRYTNPDQAGQVLKTAIAEIKASQQQKQAILRMMMLLGTSGALQSQK